MWLVIRTQKSNRLAAQQVQGHDGAVPSARQSQGSLIFSKSWVGKSLLSLAP